jgi:ribosomal-protein-alanine N-acetyltransferase
MSLPTSLTAIDTPRLRLLALPLAQLRLCLDDLPALEAELGMSISQGVFSLRVQRAIGMKIDKMQKAEPARHDWFTYWLIVVKRENLGAGLAGFKGYPDAAGKSEIGYGLDPAYQGQGYMSEAVRALVDWALQHPDCKAVTATGVTNPVSRRLLEKLGARLVEESGQGSSWEIGQASSKK